MESVTFTMYPTTWDGTVKTLTDAGHRYVPELDQAELVVYNGLAKHFPDPLPDNVKVIQNAFAGMDSLLQAGLLTDKVRWANAAGLYGRTVAESTLALILAQYHQHPRVTRAKTWKVRPEVDAATRYLDAGTTVLIVGAGGIAVELIPLLKAFECHVIAVNRSGNRVAGADETFPIEEIAELWGRADIVVALMPLTEHTRHMLNAEVFAAMKEDAIIVNVGRGPLVDTDDLVEALNSGQIAGAALDVTEPEPLPDDHPLWDMDNVVITPHTANTDGKIRSMIGDLAVKNVAAYLRGEKMPTEVDVEAGY